MKILSIDVGIQNLGLCILEYQKKMEIPFQIIDWEKVNLKTVTSSQSTQAMVKMFLSRPHCYQVDLVLIESQERAVEKMKRLGNAIQSHFETVKALQNKSFGVTWSSGPVKLRVYEGPETWTPIKVKDGYQRNKKTGIEHTRAILKQGESVADENCIYWLRWFEKLEKKDDVADAFLQGAFYLKSLYQNPPKKRKRPVCVIESESESDEDCSKASKEEIPESK